MKKRLKKNIAWFLVVVFCVSIISGNNIYGAEKTVDTVVDEMVDYATTYLGYTASDFGITGAWCVWFTRKLASDAGVKDVFSSSNVTTTFYQEMTNPNGAYKAEGYYYSDINTTGVKWGSYNKVINDMSCFQYATPVTRGNFTPQAGDIICFLFADDSCSIMSHVGFVTDYNSSSDVVTFIHGNTKSSGETTTTVKKTKTSNSYYGNTVVGYIRPNYANSSSVCDEEVALPDTIPSSSSSTAKTNIIDYAVSLVGWNRSTFVNAGRSDIPSGDWCTWFLKLCGERVGINKLFSSKTTVSTFCTDMIKNYGAKAYYYSDSSFLTSADKTVLSGATAVTKSSFTPQPGDIYILHEDGFDSLSQVGFVMKVVDGSIYAVVGNNGTAAEVQTRTSTTNYFYQITNANCPIVGYIRPDYASLDEVALTSISLSATSATLNVGGTKTLTVTYNPSNTTDSKTITWKSSDTSVATVSNGKITAVAPGTVTITATCGSKTATCKVTVKQPLSSINLSSTTLNMNVGASQTLTVTYNPSNTTDSKTVTWKSSDTSVATVSNGKITAVAPGTVTITATCGSKTATCKVTVEKTVSDMVISTKKMSMDVGGKNTLKIFDDEGKNIDAKDVVWKSSNNAIATVDSSGVVTAVSDGTVTIYASSADGTVTTSCVVTVKVAETEVVTTTKSETSSASKENEVMTTTSASVIDNSQEKVTSESDTTTGINTDKESASEVESEVSAENIASIDDIDSDNVIADTNTDETSTGWSLDNYIPVLCVIVFVICIGAIALMLLSKKK